MLPGTRCGPVPYILDGKVKIKAYKKKLTKAEIDALADYLRAFVK